jgi:hypothetical protein
MSLPPIDLTLSDNAYADMAVLAFVPVPRDNFFALKNSLPTLPPSPILPQVLANRSPLQLLQLYMGTLTILPIPPISNNAWAAAVGNQQYGFYIRRRSDPTFVPFKTPSGVSLSSSLNPSVEGNSVTFTAQISPSTTTGTVQFFDGSILVGSPATISSGAATVTTSALAVGTHPIKATYGGDSSHTPGTSPVLVQTVVKITSTTVVTSSLSPSTVGQAVTLTATVTPGTSTGTVQFSDGAPPISAGIPLSSGKVTIITSSLAVGTHTITATYSGDPNTSGSSSPIFSQVVNQVKSTLSLAPSVNPSLVTQAVTFNATVTPSTATGTVQFFDGATAISGPVKLTGGVALLNTSALTIGQHTIKASYSGDTSDMAASSSVVQTVNPIPSSVAVTPSVNPSVVTQPVIFTAHITPSSATGSVQFADGSNPLASATAVNSGTASVTTSTLTVGQHVITAAYSGDANALKSTSAPITQNVNKQNSSVTVTPSVDPSNVTQPVTFTATVSPSTATGTVQFLDGGVLFGSAVPVTGGMATLTTFTLTVGAHMISAAYSGDTNTVNSTSTPVTQSVVRLNSTVSVNPSVNPSIVGQPVTLTATVTPSAASGTVQFADGTAPIAGPAPVSGGSAALTISWLSVGTHTITAAYSGDKNDIPATSAPVTQTVRQATSSVTVNPTANPSIVGQVVTFMATVTPNSATGTVQFSDGTTPIAGPANVTGGTASVTTSSLTVGTHPIRAAYSGDTNNTASTSTPLTQTVNKITAGVNVTPSANPSIVGQAVAFTAHVTPASATGSVQFANNGAALDGPANVSAGTASTITSTLTAGTHSITADYSGDANDTSATSPALSQTVNKQSSTITVAPFPNPSIVGKAVTFTASITPPSATGTVQFADGGAVLGTAATMASGSAILTTSSLTVGTHPITSAYSGDANTLGSNSPTISQNVIKQPSTVQVTPSANPSLAGKSVTFTATVTPNTATGNVQFADGAALVGGPVPLTSTGTATVVMANLTMGTHSITAAYAGDAITQGNTSPILTQTVNKQPSTVTVTPSENPSTVGQTVIFTAKVTPASATGRVQFEEANPLSTAPTLIGGPVTLNNGLASVSDANLTFGSHSIVAVYSGDATTANSTSPPVVQTVTRVTPTVTLTSTPNPSTTGATVTFTVTVKPATATGAVQLRDGTANLGGVLTLSAAVARLTIQIPTAGAHSITANYSGDASTAPGTSNTVPQTVNNPVIG